MSGEGEGAEAAATKQDCLATSQLPSGSLAEGIENNGVDESAECIVKEEVPVLHQEQSDAAAEKDVNEEKVQFENDFEEQIKRKPDGWNGFKMEEEEANSILDAITPPQQSSLPLLQSITGLKIDDVLEMEASLAKITDGSKRQAEFVNHGYLKWEAGREKWLRRCANIVGAGEADPAPQLQKHAKPLPVDDIIDIIFAIPGKSNNDDGPTPFPEPVPLPQMVDILQDLWEAEGLDV